MTQRTADFRLALTDYRPLSRLTVERQLVLLDDALRPDILVGGDADPVDVHVEDAEVQEQRQSYECHDRRHDGDRNERGAADRNEEHGQIAEDESVRVREGDDDDADGDEDDGHEDRGDDANEEPAVVTAADALVEPFAVVVEHIDAFIAD